MSKKLKVLKNGTVIRFIDTDEYIKTCFKPFEKAVWNDSEIIQSMKFKANGFDDFDIHTSRDYSVFVPSSDIGKNFIIASGAKKIRGKKRKSKKWDESK